GRTPRRGPAGTASGLTRRHPPEVPVDRATRLARPQEPAPRHFSRPGTAYDTGMYEHFEHTADLGLRVRAADMDTLFAEAAEALFAAVVEDPTAVESRDPLAVRVAGTD